MKFSKYQGLGNSFILFDYLTVENLNLEKLAKKICDVNIGVGADGMILVKTDPLEMIFYNQDGTIAKMCGNGIRCFAKYLSDNKMLPERRFDCITGAGVLSLNIETVEPFMVKVDIGKPNYNKEEIPMNFDGDNRLYKLEIKQKTFNCATLFIGTIHTVIMVKELKEKEVIEYGALIEKHDYFPDRTNVNFVKVNSENELTLKTFERGVGLTYACGTGACAAVVTLNNLGKVSKKVKVSLPLGHLIIELTDDAVYMIGPAKKILTGDWEE